MKYYLSIVLLRFFGLFPIKKNKILFTSFYSRRYADNPKVISEYLEKYKDLDLVWTIKEGVTCSDKVRTVKTGTIRMYYEIATAHIWIDNSRKMSWFRKRKGQFYIQTWHGGVALKSIEADAEDRLTKKYIKKCKNDSKIADLMISESEWSTKNYESAFWYDGEILKSGLPRSDVLFEDVQKTKESVYEFYKLNSNVRLAVYAPTFRQDFGTEVYKLDYESVIKALTERFGGEWKLLLRLHPNVIDKQTNFSYTDNVLNGSAYQEMNDLIVASEVLITDYSSCMFDAIRLNKKVFIYAPDYDHYVNDERKLYFDIKNLPAPYCDTSDRVLENIIGYDEEKYKEEMKKFNDSIGYYSDGGSTKQVVDRILSVINNN